MGSTFSHRPFRYFLTVLRFCAFLLPMVNGLHKTDTITWGGSNDRNGYQINHNMDPANVGSPQFGLLFKTLLPGTFVINNQNTPEQVFSQPLVYTGSDGVQYLFIATTQNNVYKMDAKTGIVVTSRNLHRPFLVSDLDGCTDINPTIGVTATGVIDPTTDTWYLTAKTYKDQNANGPRGKPNGRYYVHAISTTDLSERPNFPVDLEGAVARNNPNRVFGAGIHHQRPGLLQHGQYIYAGFASHCAQYNFTGWIFGWDKATGRVVEQFATEGAGVPTSVPGGGIWMSGGGLTSDDKGSMFFSTGNGYASQLSNVPVNGRNPPTALEEAAVHMAINEDGSLRVVDFFMPWEKQQLDGADKDLGTTPLEILPSQFQCGSIKRMGVVTGKSGKTYWIDLDNMGGYQNGPNKLDNVIQVYQNENSVYAGAGVYPLEGGFIYINVIQYPTHVFQFSCNNGVPSFNWVADSPEKNAYVLGVGHGTTTSLNGQPGTGLLWTSDVEGSNLRIYDAVPQGGKLVLRNAFVTPGTTKFSRPVFGNGIVYQGTNQGYIYAYGSPINLPFNCTPLQFGSTNLNQSSAPQAVKCRTNTALTINAASIDGNANFVISGLPVFPYQVSQGQDFTFQATFIPKSVGPLSSSILLNTTQRAQGFSTSTQVQLRGTGQSQSALLQLAPNTVTFNGFITGQDAFGLNQSFTISNGGNSVLQVSSILFSTISENGPWVPPNGTQKARSVSAFTFYDLPTSIAANGGVVIPVNFIPSRSGNYAVFVQVNSNGGSRVLNVLGAGYDQPKALVEFETSAGSWIPYSGNNFFAFGNVTQNTSRYLRLRVTNTGTSNAAPLSFTVSKPPFGIPGTIVGANNQIDLGEGTLIYPGQNATATLFCSPPKSQVNIDAYTDSAVWTMNLNDPSFGKQQLRFTCNAVSEQVGALNPSTQQAYFRYAGCFKENDPGRQLQTQIYSSDTSNTNENCINQCASKGYIFAATQYRSQCWCGYNRPKSLASEDNCNFPCSGDTNQICGGNGVNGGAALLSTFGDISRWNGNSTDAPGPYVNPGALGFQSLGCYTEGSSGRALTVQPSSNNTILGCLSACVGYKFAGVEYGGQCFCGNSLGFGSVSAPGADCNMACDSNQTEYCGGPNRLNMYGTGLRSSSSSSTPSPTMTLATVTLTSSPSSLTTSLPRSSATATSTATGPPTPVATALDFTYVDCYTEGQNTRALVEKATASSTMRADICAAFCTGYFFMATEYGSECYCGNRLQAGSVKATDGRCAMTCSGNAATICGGPNGLSLYQLAPDDANVTSSVMSTSTALVSTSSSSTSTIPSSTTLSSSVTRTSSNSSTIPASTSVSPSFSSTGTLTASVMLNSTATSASSPLSTVTTTILSTTSSTSNSLSTSTTASLPTGQNTTGSSISIISASFSSLSTRTLPSSTTTTAILTSSTTIASGCCVTTANSTRTGSQSGLASTSSILLSTTNSVLTRTSSPGATLSSASSPSSSPSTSSSTSTAIRSSTTSASAVLTTPTRTTSSSTATSPTKPPSSPYLPLGCYAEPSNTRLLPLAATTSSQMTQSLCATFCASRSLPLFGLEYSRECYCGMSLPSSSASAVLSTNASSTAAGCNMPCSGSTAEICGGASRVSVYNNTLVVPPRLKATLKEEWMFKGCFVDQGAPRTVGGGGDSGGGYAFAAGNMSQEICVGACKAREWTIAGVEYGEECYCADRVRDGAVLVDEVECEAILCKGDTGEWCGGRQRVAVWEL